MLKAMMFFGTLTEFGFLLGVIFGSILRALG